MERNTNEQNTIKWLKQKYGDDIDAKLTSITVDTKLKMDIECNLKGEEFYVQVKSFTWYSGDFNGVYKLQETIRLLLNNDKYVEHHSKLRNSKFAIYRNRDNKFTIEKYVSWDTDPKETKSSKEGSTMDDDKITPKSYALERIKESRHLIKYGSTSSKTKYHTFSPMAFEALFDKTWEEIKEELGDALVKQLKRHFEYWANLTRWFKKNEDMNTSRTFYEFVQNESGIVLDKTHEEDIDFSQIKVIEPLENEEENKGDLDEYLS